MTLVKTIIVNDPRGCHLALVRAIDPLVIIDIETTGIKPGSTLVSVGVLVDQVAYILFVGSIHASIDNLTVDQLRFALEPLTVPNKLIVAGYNFLFDFIHLDRVGAHIVSTIHELMQILRLLDSDRGPDGFGVKTRRLDRRAPAGANPFLNYKLKDVVPQLCGIKMIHFPGRIEEIPLKLHVTYVTSDLVGARASHDRLWPRIFNRLSLYQYYETLAAPITPMLADMTILGIMADVPFIQAEIARLDAIVKAASDTHLAAFGSVLPVGDHALLKWIFGTLGVWPLERNLDKKTGKRIPSLKENHLAALLTKHATNAHVSGSLALIIDYRKAKGLRSKMNSLLASVAHDGRIHSALVDRQATGRVSSTKPNLQNLAKVMTITGEEFYPRNGFMATPGYVLVAFDLAKADVTMLAHAMESFPRRGSKHIKLLRQRRLQRLTALDPNFAMLYAQMKTHRNPFFYGKPFVDDRLDFDPKLATGMADDFRLASGNFYKIAATKMLGKPPATKQEYDDAKRVVLSTMNSMGPKTLAKRQGTDKAKAKAALDAFDAAYPQFQPFRSMLMNQIVLTGGVTTFMNRPRLDTAQTWMATRTRVEINVSFKNSDAYWLDVTPLQPRRNVLCCYIHRAWDALPGRFRGQLIFDAILGKLSGRPYKLFDQATLEFLLPYRNISWRNIRAVRTPSEQSPYRGFDKTARSLINHIFQGGTADLARILMLRSPAICDRFGARMLLQIHDELVFEVPATSTDHFIRVITRELSRPPCPNFKVPVVLEAKAGLAFGSMKPVIVADMRPIASLRPPRPYSNLRSRRFSCRPVWPVGAYI
jgi:DNA polymerase I-like protein with 3'-5' exonuclease and polymerase domains